MSIAPGTDPFGTDTAVLPDESAPLAGGSAHYLSARHSTLSSGTPLRSRLLLALVGLLGAATMLYPLAASWFAQLDQSQLTSSYSSQLSDETVQERAAALESAHAYNDTLTGGGAYDPFTQQIADVSSAQYADYLAQLQGVPTGVMARVKIPAIGVDLPIYHGTSDSTLLQGVGHLFGTALPVGGPGTHTVLTGHSGLASAVLFTNLEKLTPGDLIQVETYGEKFTYQVRDLTVIEPHDTGLLAPIAGEDLISLVTCTPIGINSHRLVVTAERIPNPAEPSAALPEQSLPGFPWWLVWSGVALILALLFVLLGGGGGKGRHSTLRGAVTRR